MKLSMSLLTSKEELERCFYLTTLIIDIVKRKCYNACEKSLENKWGEGEGNTVEYISC